jgi:hypothetical protein
MIRFTINVDTRGALAKIKAAQLNAEKAAVEIVNTLAFKAREDFQKSIDTNTTSRPWIRKGVLVKKATDTNKVALVYVAAPQAKYLYENIFGGARPLKAFEARLKSAGILPSGMYAVPGPGLPLDAYGSPKRAALVQILAAVAPGVGPRMTKRGKVAGRQYFAVSHPMKNLRAGIYATTAGRTVAMLWFTPRAPRYTARLPFYDVVRASVARNLDAAARRALDRAMR